MKIAAALVAIIAALVWGLAPGIAGAQSVLDAPSNLTATPGAGAVHLSWTVPSNAEYHFVAWLPVGAPASDAQIRPVDAIGEATITGLTPMQAYRFTVIASRWEWSPANFGPKWSAWSAFATATPMPPASPLPGIADSITSSSTSANNTVKMELTIGNLPRDLVAGSSIELYLEDDFKVPGVISPGSVYIAVVNPSTEATNHGGRMYATDPIEVHTAGYFTAGRDDYAIRVFIPDMNTGDAFDGFDAPMMGQTLDLVFTWSAGIKNPSEEGTHSVGYSVLGPNDAPNEGPEVRLGTVATYAKINLSDERNVRGYQLTVTGSGFNNGASASLYVLANPDTTANLWRMVDAGGEQEAQACDLIIREGHRVGVATVDSYDKVAIKAAVTSPIFRRGNVNFMCMVDGEGRKSSTDVEVFDLEPSIRISPQNAIVGDTITVFAQDYPRAGATFSALYIANQLVMGNEVSIVPVNANSIGSDGSAMATFTLPDSVAGSPLEGSVPIDAAWGNVLKGAWVSVLSCSTTVTPGTGRPGDDVQLSVAGMPVYTEVSAITIGGHDVLGARKLRTDRNGTLTTTVTIPAIDTGIYPVVVRVGEGANQSAAGCFLMVLPYPTITGTVEVTPDRVFPGDEVRLSVAGMPANTEVSAITISIFDILRDLELRTDQRGALTARITIPGLDGGTYPVIVWVGDSPNQTIAIASLTVLP